MLRQTSLGTLGLTIGGTLTIVGFYAYFTGNSTLNLVGFFYGIPLLLGGLALKVSELKPVAYTQPTTPEITALREKQATDTQNQIRQDITRYRYGQDAHLDTSLSHLNLSPSDEERPLITGLRETATNGAYTLIIDFYSPLIPLTAWEEKHQKMTSFFGPGIEVEIKQPKKDAIELSLIANSEAKK